MKQFAVLALIVLGLVVLGIGGYLLVVDPDDGGDSRTDRTRDAAPDAAEADDGESGAPLPPPRGDRTPRSPGPSGAKPRPPRPAPRSIEDLKTPVRIERGSDATVLRGCVLRPTGDPLASAVVELIRVTRATILDTGTRVRVAEAVTTDAKGCFAFRGFAGGRDYLLRVEHGSYAAFELAQIEAPAERETILPDIRVAPGGTIVGTVTAPGNAPVEGARVLAFARSGSLGFDTRLPVKQVLTDARGDFALTNLAFGGYALTIEAAAMRTLRSPMIEVTNASAPLRRDFRLEPGKMLRGKVVDEHKEPIAGATVEAFLRAVGGPAEARGLTDADGTFVLDGLGPDELRLTASKAGYSSGSLAPVDPDSKTLAVLHLTANVSITGFVVAKDTQKPITSFGLMLWSIGKGDTLAEPLGGLRAVERSADGSFTIEDVAPGDYRIQGFANDYAPSFTPTFRVKRQHVYGVTIELDRGASLTGRVVAGDGKPISGAVVRMFDNAYTKLPISQLLYGEFTELKKPVTTDDEGRFVFENLPPGLVQLRVSATGRMPLVRRDVDVAAAGATQIGDLVLGLGGTVRGIVTDADGGVARAARVSLRSAAGESETTKADNEGMYEFRNVTPGEYTVSAEPVASAADANFLSDAIAAARSTKTVTVYDEQTTRLDIQLVRIR